MTAANGSSTFTVYNTQYGSEENTNETGCD